MRKTISMLLAAMLFLSILPVSAEEAFNVYEETEFTADDYADRYASDNWFGGEEEFPVEKTAELQQTVDLEDRSGLSLLTDQETDETVVTANPWKAAPTLSVTETKPGTVKLTWTASGITAMPKTVRYCVYAVNEVLGTAIQVGKPIKPKGKNGTYTGTVTLKNQVEGTSYFVRAENLIRVDRKTKADSEEYGLSSEIQTYTGNDGLWATPYEFSATQNLYGDVELAFAPQVDWTEEYDFDITATWTVNRKPVHEKVTKTEEDGGWYIAPLTPPAGATKVFFTLAPSRMLPGGKVTGKTIRTKTLTLGTVLQATQFMQEKATDAPVVNLRWVTAALPASYVITGYAVRLTLTLDGGHYTVTGGDAEVSVVEVDSSSDKPLYEISVSSTAKDHAMASFAVTPAGGNALKATLALTAGWRAQPTIVWGTQTDDLKVRLVVSQPIHFVDGISYAVTGFKDKLTLTVLHGELTGVPAGYSVVAMETNEFVLEGPVKKAGKVRFTVQPINGKVKGPKSSVYKMTVMKADRSSAMDVRMEKVGSGVEVSFRSLYADVKEYRLSIVDGFTVGAYSHRIVLTRVNGDWTTEDQTATATEADGRITVTLTELPEGTYTSVVETILLNGGRRVDLSTSLTIAYTEGADDEATGALRAALEKEKTYRLDGIPIVYGEGAILKGQDWLAGYEYRVDGGEPVAYDPVVGIVLAAGTHTLEVRKAGESDWSKAIEVTVVAELKAVLTLNPEAPVIGGNAVASVAVTGGSGEYSVTYRTGEEEIADGILTNLQPGTLTLSATVVDEKLSNELGARVSTTATVTVEVTDTAKTGMLDYEVNGTEARATAYHKSENRTPGSVTVPGTIPYGGVEYTVTEIASGLFANDQDLTEVYLPELEVIPSGAFEGCTKLVDVICE